MHPVELFSVNKTYSTKIPYKVLIRSFNSSLFDNCDNKSITLPFLDYTVREFSLYMKGKKVSQSSIEPLLSHLEAININKELLDNKIITIVSNTDTKYKFNFVELIRSFEFFKPFEDTWKFDVDNEHRVDLTDDNLTSLQDLLQYKTVKYANISTVLDMFILNTIKAYKYIDFSDINDKEKMELYKKIESKLSDKQIEISRTKITSIFNLTFINITSAVLYKYNIKETCRLFHLITTNEQIAHDLVLCYRQAHDIKSSTMISLESPNGRLTSEEIEHCYYTLELPLDTFGNYARCIVVNNYLRSIIEILKTDDVTKYMKMCGLDLLLVGPITKSRFLGGQIADRICKAANECLATSIGCGVGKVVNFASLYSDSETTVELLKVLCTIRDKLDVEKRTLMLDCFCAILDIAIRHNKV